MSVDASEQVPPSALRGGSSDARGLTVERWLDAAGSQYGEGGESARPGWGEPKKMLTKSCIIVLKCLEWTIMSPPKVQCCVRTHTLPYRLEHQAQAEVEADAL